MYCYNTFIEIFKKVLKLMEGENFNLTQFQKLLNKLEASKKRQVSQKSMEGRRDIFTQGLAGMMSNF